MRAFAVLVRLRVWITRVAVIFPAEDVLKKRADSKHPLFSLSLQTDLVLRIAGMCQRTRAPYRCPQHQHTSQERFSVANLGCLPVFVQPLRNSRAELKSRLP